MPKNSKPEVMVALMGPTGTGKSTFINLLTKDKATRIGHDLESQTINVNMASYTMDGRRITLVDTPGFDDSRQGVTDTDVLESIANFLQANGGRRLNGVIYLHRISDPSMGGMLKKNLRMFRELCGDNNFKNVRIVTTYWSSVEKQEGTSRQTALAKGAFNPLIEGGAKLIAHDRELESARQIVSELIQQTPVKLKIQEELDAGEVLADTSAGGVIMEELKEVQQKHNKEMEDLKKEIEDAAMENDEDLEAELAEEQRRLQKVMAQMEEDQKRMAKTRIVRKTQAQQDKQKTIDKSTEMAMGAVKAKFEVDKGKAVANSTAQDIKNLKLARHEHGSEFKQTPAKLMTRDELHVLTDTSASTEMDDLKREIGVVKASNKDLQVELGEQRRKLDKVMEQLQEQMEHVRSIRETLDRQKIGPEKTVGTYDHESEKVRVPKRRRWYLCGL